MSAANFAPFKPSPDERLGNVRGGPTGSGPSTSAGSSAATSPRPASATRSSLHGAMGGGGGGVATKSKLDEVLGRGSLENGYKEEEKDEDVFDPRYATESYQSSTPQTQQSFTGGAATVASSYSSGSPFPASAARPAWSDASPAAPSQSRPQPYGFGGAARVDSASYSTAQGFNLSNLCFAAWSLPPFSSVILLIYETENDLVRFHAYQAGMFGIAAVLFLWILRSWFGWYAISVIVGMASLGYAWVCGSNAANAAPTLTRSPYLPGIGPLAEQWLGDE